jgi:hypothetical protein
MGRKKKYLTDEQLVEAQKRWSLEYYYRNKEKINKKIMENYYELRKNLQSNNRDGQKE